jgi:hypothetical protein
MTDQTKWIRLEEQNILDGTPDGTMILTYGRPFPHGMLVHTVTIHGEHVSTAMLFVPNPPRHLASVPEIPGEK